MSLAFVIITTVILTIFGKKIVKKLYNQTGIVVDSISKEEAAMTFIERKVEFVWRPQIIDKPIISNVVDFDDVKTKKTKRKRHEAKV